ncbi:MAG: nucleotidyltransferase domain-containing protein [Clostridia bacterium]|nr:nucleotidyltransferase domain-containing protein [Clostridia bacterium]
MTLRELRKNKGITQQEAASFVEVPLRTYVNYENDPSKQKSIKYKYMLEKLLSYGYVDEENGILTLDEIRAICSGVFSGYPIEYCYLFGSYAKGRATPTSDVDLFIHTTVTGIQFFGLVEELREKLKKKVDVLDQKQIVNNFDLTNEILKDGIKIYG